MTLKYIFIGLIVSFFLSIVIYMIRRHIEFKKVIKKYIENLEKKKAQHHKPD